MPIYEYKCQVCGKSFDVIQKFSDSPLTVHEECGGAVVRVISPSALMFKGSGWYVNDYGRKGKSQDTGSNGKAEPKEAKKESKDSAAGKSESKPAPTVSGKQPA